MGMKHFILMIAGVALVGGGKGATEREEVREPPKVVPNSEFAEAVIKKRIYEHLVDKGGRGLVIDNRRISDLTPLSEFKHLKTISLYNNEITNLTPLSGMKKLEFLYLRNNQITDLSPLYGLKKLDVLTLDDNPNLTRAEIEKLQKALPYCKISHNAKE